MKVKISVSIASAPLVDIEKTIKILEQSKIDYLHFDVEDGCFVPALTLGTKIIEDLRHVSSLPFEVHLMVKNPEWLIDDVIKKGANRIAIHYEACLYPRRVLQRITSLGVAAGIAINPATPLPDLRFLLPYLDFILILSTEPERDNPLFLHTVLDKVRNGKSGDLKNVEWVVDGGVSPDNITEIINAGADTVVVGRSVFKDGKIRENIAALRLAATRG